MRKLFVGWIIVATSIPVTLSFSDYCLMNNNRRIGCLHWNQQRRLLLHQHYNWLRDFFEPPTSSSGSDKQRQIQYPEQYPATYEINDAIVEEDDQLPLAKSVRPLLKNTQLESRPLQLVYDANKDGWNPTAFHNSVDGKGAAIVVAYKKEDESIIGCYNPKGWASLGGARPSVAAFLFYQKQQQQTKNENDVVLFQKLRKIGGGGLACAADDPNFGISMGPDGLVINLQQSQGMGKQATSKLGTYYECGPEERYSICDDGSTVGGGSAAGASCELSQLYVLVGIYENEDDIPYTGGVLDCPQPGSI